MCFIKPGGLRVLDDQSVDRNVHYAGVDVRCPHSTEWSSGPVVDIEDINVVSNESQITCIFSRVLSECIVI